MPLSAPVDLKKPIDYAALKDRNVLITGGASGFGKAFVHKFAEHGANIVFGDVQEGPGKELEQELAGQGIKVKFVQVDVSAFDSQVHMVREALAFFPRNEIDVFIPNAGLLNAPTQIEPQDPAALADLKTPTQDLSLRVLTVNLLGVFQGVFLVLRYGMGLHKAAEGGTKPAKTVVLIDSLAGYCGAEGSVEYTASKWGVRGILRGWRKQLAGMGVRLNSVAPFYVETPMTDQAVPMLKQAGIPLTPIDSVVEAAVRLATDEAAFGRAVFAMPEGLSDAGDDSEGGHGGKAFSVEGLGEQWALFVNGPLSDQVQP